MTRNRENTSDAAAARGASAGARADLHAPLPPRLHPPRLARLLARTRLFQRIDHLRTTHSIVWCSAPAGSGKTALIASYLEHRGEVPLWYQLNRNDADPAAFFANLAQAAAALAPDAPALPPLTPEYLLAPRIYAANCFQALFGSVGPRRCIVFDNYQDAGDDIALHGLIAAGLEVIPEGMDVIVVSRHAPPADFIRLRVASQLAELDFSDLKLTPDELQSIARLFVNEDRLDGATLQQLHAATGGWTAGLMLYLQQLDRPRWQPLDTQGFDPQQIFDYFATELFQQVDAQTRDFLTAAALLPFMTTSATRTLTGVNDASDRLARFASHNFFTMRLEGQPDTYEFHPLFRAFLHDRLRHDPRAERRLALLRHAAELLEQDGRIEDAAHHLQEAQDWPALAALVVRHAVPALLEGRWQTVRAWLDALPPPMVEDNPWLRYSRALASMATDLFAARADFWEALQRFRARGDAAGAYLALSGGIDTFNYLWLDFVPLDQWLDAYELLRTEFPRIPSPEIEARVIYAMLSGHMWRRPHVPAMEHWAGRARELLAHCPDATTRVMVGSYLLLFYLWWKAQPLRADAIFDQVRVAAGRDDVAVLARLFWHVMQAAYLYFRNDGPGAVAAAHRGLDLARSSGVPHLSLLLHAQAIYGYLTAFDHEGAHQQLASMQELLQDTTTFDYAHYHYLATWVHLNRDDPRRALEHARVGVESADRIAASIYPYFSRIALAQACYEAGDTAQALQSLADMAPWADKVGLSYCHCQQLYLQADQALARGDLPAFSERMHAAWAIHERDGHAMLPWVGWRGPLLQRLYGACVEHDVCRDQASAMLQQRQLVPSQIARPAPGPTHPIKVYTLGHFVVEVDGQPLTFRGRVQRRPLELLQAIVAFGSHHVPCQSIIDELWPQGRHSKAAEDSLATTLQRLRTLLGHHAAVQLRNNRLTLAPDLVWVDTLAVEALLPAPDAEPPDVERLLTLYRGAFLAHEPDTPWFWPLRERLRARVLDALRRGAAILAAQDQSPQAVALLLRAIDQEPLAEVLYADAMRLHLALGQHNAALTLYQRCEKTLAGVLGVRPSAETDALHRQARHAAA